MKNNITDIQLALVLQGGGALGAYEAGVLKVLCDALIEGKVNAKKEGPLFDIIAGISVGAMNAAVLISNVVKGTILSDLTTSIQYVHPPNL